MVKAVVFDMDGVLIDTEKWLVRYWCQAAQEAGFDMKPEHALQIRSLAGEFAEPYLKKIFGPQFSYWAIRERRKELMREHILEFGIEKKQGVDEILDYLRANRIRTAVATATDLDRTKDYLTQIGVYDKFDRIICASMVKHGKPEPDIYLYACKEIGLEPKYCAAVEDSPNGIRSAVGAGLLTVMVRDLTISDVETSAMITAEVSTLNDMILLLEDHVI